MEGSFSATKHEAPFQGKIAVPYLLCPQAAIGQKIRDMHQKNPSEPGSAVKYKDPASEHSTNPLTMNTGKMAQHTSNVDEGRRIFNLNRSKFPEAFLRVHHRHVGTGGIVRIPGFGDPVKRPDVANEPMFKNYKPVKDSEEQKTALVPTYCKGKNRLNSLKVSCTQVIFEDPLTSSATLRFSHQLSRGDNHVDFCEYVNNSIQVMRSFTDELFQNTVEEFKKDCSHVLVDNERELQFKNQAVINRRFVVGFFEGQIVMSGISLERRFFGFKGEILMSSLVSWKSPMDTRSMSIVFHFLQRSSITPLNIFSKTPSFVNKDSLSIIERLRIHGSIIEVNSNRAERVPQITSNDEDSSVILSLCSGTEGSVSRDLVVPPKKIPPLQSMEDERDVLTRLHDQGRPCEFVKCEGVVR